MATIYRAVILVIILFDFTKVQEALALASECNGELGMESKKIPDQNITSSSELSSNHTAAFARLDGRRAWCSAPEDDSPYVQIQLDEEKSITSIETQGSYSDFSWARNYEVRYLKEGNWTSYKEELLGNRNSRSLQRNEFDPPIRTRSIRIYPKDPLAVMMDITVPCLRLELYGCTAAAFCPEPAKIAHGSYSGSDFSEGSAVIYTCDDQYFLKGSSSITCANGQWNASPPVCREASTCKNIYDNNFSSGNKAYLLRIGSGKIPIYCHMTSGELGACGGGGWTLVMKIDGSQRTFHYDSLLWNDKSDFNLAGGKTGFDAQETKLPTYWNTSFSKICLGMKFSQQIRSFVINKHASSLHSLIADGKYRATSLGRDTWKELIGSQASLQTHCNREGFNVQSKLSPWSKARIGILANNENQCDTCDSRIGFGTGGRHDDSNTCGNQATYSGDNGNQHIKVIGFILVK